jgi:hypothetical protein
MDEISSGHTTLGARFQQSAAQGGQKDVFPQHMTHAQIESAIRQAYRQGRLVESQGVRRKVVGPFESGTIHMWVNTETKTIETAYPNP